jgi:hypothetical protein
MEEDEWEGGPWNDSSDNEAKGTVDKILDFAIGVGVPVARLALGRSAEEQVQQDRQQFNRLNGSGSNDWRTALNQPGGLTDWAFGTPASRQMAQTGGLSASPGINPMLLIGGGLAAIVLIALIMRK